MDMTKTNHALLEPIRFTGSVQQVNANLLTIPPELQLLILSRLRDRRDIYSVARTCKSLEHMVVDRLYDRVEIWLPQEATSLGEVDGSRILRNDVINAIRNLTIRDKADKREYCGPNIVKIDDSRPSVKCLMNSISPGKLQSLSFRCSSAVPVDLLRTIAEEHANTLQHLSCFEIEYVCGSLPFNNLKSIECNSINSSCLLARLIDQNQETLESLKIGQEKELLAQYYRDNWTCIHHDSMPIMLVRSIIDISQLPRLTCLSLVGVDVSLFIREDVDSVPFFAELRSLTLESCNGSAAFLATMATLFQGLSSATACTTSRRPVLEQFLFRQESFSTSLRDVLIVFLRSFSGLKTLSLLFENTSVLDHISNLIGNHGATLAQLVLETRISPRKLSHINTSRPFGYGGYNDRLWEESTMAMCTSCPNLTELGIGFSWKDETLRSHNCPITSLEKLKAIHIRNFPELDVQQVGNHTTKQYARKLVDWMYTDTGSRHPPPLETLSIGPTLYETKHPGSNPSRNVVPEWLRTHHFVVDWAKTRFGKWTAMISPVSERYVQELRNEDELGGIFQQVWLK